MKIADCTTTCSSSSNTAFVPTVAAVANLLCVAGMGDPAEAAGDIPRK